MSSCRHDARWSGVAAVLHVLEAEPALDAQVAVGHRVVARAGDLDDGVVLNVQRELATDAAIRTDRVGLCLRRFVPRVVGAHVVLAGEHQCARRADSDAVAAVHTGRVGQGDVELGGDV